MINALSEEMLTKARSRGACLGGGTGVAETMLDVLPIHLAPLADLEKTKRNISIPVANPETFSDVCTCDTILGEKIERNSKHAVQSNNFVAPHSH